MTTPAQKKGSKSPPSQIKYLLFESIDSPTPFVMEADDYEVDENSMMWLYINKEVKAIINMNMMKSMEIVSPEDLEETQDE